MTEMNARDRLELIGVKIGRANEHFRTLEIEVRQYLDSKPYSIGVKRHPESRRLIYFVENVNPTPIKLSAILGDVIHNLRSSLDHLAYQRVRVGTGTQPSSRVYFPIADDNAKYPEQRTRQMNGATQAAITAIDALAPYRGGNDTLWQTWQTWGQCASSCGLRRRSRKARQSHSQKPGSKHRQQNCKIPRAMICH
jgi:hypothetical protein